MIKELLLLSLFALSAFYFGDFAFELMEKRKDKSIEEKRKLTKYIICFLIFSALSSILFALSLHFIYIVYLDYYVEDNPAVMQFLSFVLAILLLSLIIWVARSIPCKRKNKDGKRNS